jgi:hypothetical protein
MRPDVILLRKAADRRRLQLRSLAILSLMHHPAPDDYIVYTRKGKIIIIVMIIMMM